MRAGVAAGIEQRLELADRAEEQRRRTPCSAATPAARRRADRLHARQVGHAVDEEQARQHEPDLHGERQVEHHGDHERRQQHGAIRDRVALRRSRKACQSPMLSATTISTADSAASGTYCASGAATSTIASSVSAWMMPGDGRARAGADVGRGARDRARGRNAAEERRDDVGDALRHQLLVGIVAVVDLRVGHARGQQRFDGAEQRDRDRRRDQVAQRRQRDRRASANAGSACGNAAEARADRLARRAPSTRDDERGDDQHDDRARQRASARRGRGASVLRERAVARPARSVARVAAAWSSASSAWPGVRDRLRPQPAARRGTPRDRRPSDRLDVVDVGGDRCAAA